MKRAIAALPLVAVMFAGSVAAQGNAEQFQQSKPEQSITVGDSVFTISADEPPVIPCVSEVTLRQQGRVWAKGFVIVELANGKRAVGGEWAKDVTDLPGWREAVPDDCGTVVWHPNKAGA